MRGGAAEPRGPQREAERVRALEERLAATEDALQRERNRAHRLEAQALYMQTAVSRFVPPKSFFHPSALASNSQAPAQNHATVVLASDDDTVTISRTAYELLQLKDRAMDSIKEGITIADCSLPDMPLMYANQGFSAITGCPVADVLGKNCRFLQGEGTDAASVQRLREAVARGQACQVTLTNYRRNGDAFVNYLSVTPVHNARGQLTHYVGVQSDITELVNHRKAELAAKHEAAQAAAATEAKSQFLARMSHEIRTPLNGMIAVGQLLAEESLSASQRDLVNTIRCSGETLLILITDILDFSRIEANKLVLSLHEFRLRPVLEAALEIAGLAAAEKRLQVSYHIHSEVPELLVGDSQRLQQVLLNVLNNAVKFTDEGQILCEVWLESEEQPASGAAAAEGPASGRDALPPLQPAPAPEGAAKGAAGCPQLQARVEQERAGSFGSSAQPPTPTRVEVRSSPQASLSPATAGTSRDSPQQGGTPEEREQEAGCSGGGAGGCTHTACGQRLGCFPADSGRQYTVHFAVRDTGIGISDQDLGRLFQVFSQADSSRTRQHGGSGLGLAICKRLVEAMGGSMWASSRGRGQGSAFHFRIRCPAAGSGAAPAPPSDAPGGGRLALRAEPPGGEGGAEDVGSVAEERGPGDAKGGIAELRQVLSNMLHKPADSPGLLPPQQDAAAPAFAALEPGDCGLAGKKVLLAEPCTMVRRCLLLYLRQLGMAVREASTAEQAVACLRLQGQLTRKGSQELGEPGSPRRRASLQLERGARDAEPGTPVAGPFDVVVMDIAFSNVLNALIQAAPSEAQRVVFLGWPGHHEQNSLALASSRLRLAQEAPKGGGFFAAQGLPDVGSRPPRAQKEDMRHRATTRQLGYVTISRPIRQERLKLAVQEVLRTSLERSSQDGCERLPLREADSCAQLSGLEALHAAGRPASSADLKAGAMGARSNSSSSLSSCVSRQLPRNLRVLLAEDNVINMKVALGILQRIGFKEVVCAADGVAALEEIAARGGCDCFDIVLTDLHMPRKGGIELVKEIRETWPDAGTKVVAVTADAFEETRDMCFSAGFDGWLAKPFRIQDLSRVMDLVLSMRSPLKSPASLAA